MSSPKDDNKPRFLRNIMKQEKKKRVIKDDSDEEDGLNDGKAGMLSDSEDEQDTTRRSKRIKTTETAKKGPIPRKKGDTASSVLPKIKKKSDDDVKKPTSSLIQNITASAAPPTPAAKKEPRSNAGNMTQTKDSNRIISSKDNALMPAPVRPSPVASKQQQPPEPAKMSPLRSNKPADNMPTDAFKVAIPAVLAKAPPVVTKTEQARKNSSLTPKGRVMLKTLEGLCDTLQEHTHFQLILRGSLMSATAGNGTIDLSGMFSRDETQMYDFFDTNKEGDIVIPPKIPIFPEEFPPGFTGHSLHWWGIVDPAVGARTEAGKEDRNKRSSGDRRTSGDKRSLSRSSPGRGGPPSHAGGGGGGGGGWDHRGYSSTSGPPPPQQQQQHWGQPPPEYYDRRGGGGEHHHQYNRGGGGQQGRGGGGRGPSPVDRPPMDRDRRGGPPSQTYPPARR
jgi:hypothetical protein